MGERPKFCLAVDEATPCACGATNEGNDPVRGVCQARHPYPRPKPLVRMVLVNRNEPDPPT